MRTAAIISVAGHGAIIALAYVGMPALFEPQPVANIPITVEIVIIAEETAAPPPEPEPKPPKAEPEPEPVVAEAPPEPEPPPPLRPAGRTGGARPGAGTRPTA